MNSCAFATVNLQPFMNREQAKLILTAYRPGGEDAADPFFADALQQARRDPELAAWFADQRRFDIAARNSLNLVAPPADLRSKILVLNCLYRFQSGSRLSRLCRQLQLLFFSWVGNKSRHHRSN